MAGNWFRRAAFLAGLSLVSACAGPLSALEPEGPAARAAATLWWVMLWGSAAIFLWVSAALLLALTRPAGLRALGPKRTLTWGGIVLPLVILTALVASAFALGERLLAHPREPAPLRIEAVARQWAWEFRYPGGWTTTGTLHLPAGRDVDFAVVSEDVIHSFWIPRLGGKIDAVPGHENVVRLRADRPGAYGGVCAEFCGIGHAAMRFLVEAHEEEAFAALTGEGGE